MKKKTKFRLKNDLAVPFWIAILICLLCAAFSFFLFYQSFFKALSKLNEEPIATITFKYKTAQRKFLDRVVWDRLRQNSPVYDGDTIHTAELSEATVWFVDGTVLDLDESTMAQVFLHTDGTLAANLEKGSASVDSSAGGKGFAFTSENVSIVVKNGSRASVQKNEGENKLSLVLQEGSAELSDGKILSENAAFLISENESEKQSFSVVSPLLNEKILYFEEGDCPVDFEWKAGNQNELTLLLASDKDFKIVNQTLNVSGNLKSTLNLPKGTHYWKLYDKNQNEVTGKLQIVQSLKPELLTPVKNYYYQYRTVLPSVRFIWTESQGATAYNFVLSKSPDMRNPVIEQRSSMTSLILSTLQEGTYYFQVTPFYVANRLGLANPSEVGTFKIVKQGSLLPPMLSTPSAGEFVDKTKEKITLSWKMDTEASFYKVSVSKKNDLTSPIFLKETKENFVNLNQNEIQNLSDGEYFWSVTLVDSEGNESPKSKIRSFYAMNGKIEQRTVFPPDGYKLWRVLCADTRFTWKSNINFAEKIQIARDKNFSNIVLESESISKSFVGANLGEGTYYWRVSASSGNFTKSTEPKEFFVLDELPAPTIFEPTLSKRAVIKSDEKCDFSWKKQDESDYYRVKIFKGETLLLDENFISENHFAFDMRDFEEGVYRWELQAFSYETAESSRRSSRLSSTDFFLRKIRPVTLKKPAHRTHIDGWEAIENPGYFEWASSEKFSDAQIILTKKGAGGKTQSFKQNSYRSKIPQLSGGEYEWTVKALTMDDLDISATGKFSFTVEPIPPFEMPKDAKTETTDFFDASYLRKKQTISFVWQKVNRARSYIFEIRDSAGKIVLRKILDGNENTNFVLDDLTILSKGEFNWSVKAVRFSDDKKTILVDGAGAQKSFTVDFAINSNGGKRKKKGEFYAE